MKFREKLPYYEGRCFETNTDGCKNMNDIVLWFNETTNYACHAWHNGTHIYLQKSDETNIIMVGDYLCKKADGSGFVLKKETFERDYEIIK